MSTREELVARLSDDIQQQAARIFAELPDEEISQTENLEIAYDGKGRLVIRSASAMYVHHQGIVYRYAGADLEADTEMTAFEKGRVVAFGRGRLPTDPESN